MSWNFKDAKDLFERTMFRELSDYEENQFRQWARDNSHKKPDSLFHPVVNDELRKIQAESR